MTNNLRRCAALLLLILLSTSAIAQTHSPLELSRPVRSWEFLPVVGQRAALFGDESGNFEGWVYPLKLFKNFHVNFLAGNQVLPGSSLARTLIVRPESATIVYSSDTFSVRQTMFAPVHEPGVVMIFEITTIQPVEIEAAFERDFQLEWPAALGGSYLYWDPALHAFAFGEEQRKYLGLVGSPTGSETRQEFHANYALSRENAIRLGPTSKNSETRLLVLAGSSQGLNDASATYRHLTQDYASLLNESAKYYSDYLNRTVNLELPDARLQQAYDWSRISMLQGFVTNPDLGTGMIAGYRTAGDSQRPGFVWFFGRDSLWTSLALTASGDYASTRTAIDFISKFQRDDGKIPHEVAQTAKIVDWFKNYPYGFASADATPLYIIATDDYVTQSGDTEFAKQKWDSLWKAYQFLRSTYDEQGIPKNVGIGHGWVEGGPLLPVKAEIYQAGLGAAALRSLSHLASLIGKHDESSQLSQAFAQQKSQINRVFWSDEKKLFAFALDNTNKRVDTPTVLSTVPMWFEVLDSAKTQQMISVLAAPNHEADWGMRIIADDNPLYNPSGYHFGSVWPLFTGWASVGEYRYHRALPAYSNLRANALLASDGSLGHVTEVLSGDFHEGVATSSPHQIWSAAMVVSPILRGMMGLESDANSHTVKLTPHIPADWRGFTMRDVAIGQTKLNFIYTRTAEEITLQIEKTGTGEATVNFAPAVSLRAKVLRADVDGRAVSTKLDSNDQDQHIVAQFPISRASSTLRIRLKDDFAIGLNNDLPRLGESSRGLRVISESWDASRNTYTMKVAGVAGQVYVLPVLNSAVVASVEQGEFSTRDELTLKFPVTPGVAGYVEKQIVFHFKPR